MFIARICEDTGLLIAASNKGVVPEPNEGEVTYFVYFGPDDPSVVMTARELLEFLADPENESTYFGFHA